jgi:putative endonuclease
MKNGSQSQKNNHRQQIGRLGEDRAAAFFVAQGFNCIARNWRCQAGEIDLIIARNQEIRFVEVKTRRTRAYGAPEEAVTGRKQAHLQASAEIWILSQNLPLGTTFQFDVFSLYLPKNQPEEQIWLENI